MLYLHKNLPGWERLLRLAAGALVVAAAVMLPLVGLALWLALAVAAVLVLTGFVGVCPACAMVGRQPLRKAP